MKKFLRKAGKGDAGYIDYQRFIRTARTAVLFLIPIAAYVLALLMTGTKENLITIIAVVGLIPACMSAVSVVMVYTIRSIPADMYGEIASRCGTLTMGYELYMTNYDKNTLLDAVAICGDTIVGLATYKNPNRKDAETHMLNMVRSAGFRASVNVLTEPEKFYERLESMNAHADDLRKDIAPKKDSRYPEETYEEQLMHILLSVSL